MNPIRFSFAAMCGVFFTSLASLAYAQVPTPSANLTPPRALLYEISAPAHAPQTTATAKAYLLFALPFAKKDFYPVEDKVLQAYQQADTLGVEADISDEQKNAVAAQALRYGKKDQLKKHLSPATWASLNKMLGKQAQQFQSDHAVSVALGLRLSAAMDLGYQTELSADLHFLRAAQHDDKQIAEFDSILARDQRLASLSNKEADAYLSATLKAYQSGELTKETQAIEDAWRKAEPEALATAYAAAIKRDLGSQKIHALLITERNAAIADQLQTQVGQGKKLFAVLDAARLSGEKSILSILKNRGYDIKLVTP